MSLLLDCLVGLGAVSHFPCLYCKTGVHKCTRVCVCVCEREFSHVQLFVTPWTVDRQALLSVEFSRQEY